MLNDKQRPQLNDGVVDFYDKFDIAEPGDMPNYQLKKLLSLRYQNRILGYNRVYSAKSANQEVDRVIRVLNVKGLDALKIAVIGNIRYTILRASPMYDTTPETLELTLELYKEGDE